MGGVVQAAQEPYMGLMNYWLRGKEQDRAEDWFYEQQNYLQELFPFISDASNALSNIYDKGAWGDIEDWLKKPIPPTAGERETYDWFYNTFPGVVDEAAGRLRGLWPEVESMIGTRGDRGEPVDIQPIVDWAQQQFEEPFMGAAAERFGSNITGSGFQQVLRQGAESLAADLGREKVSAQEAGMGRFMDTLGTIAPYLYQAPINLEASSEQLRGKIGEWWRNIQEITRKGARLAGFLPTAQGLVTSQNWLQPGYPQYGSDFSNWGSALGTGASAGLGALSNLPWDKWLGGGGGNNTVGFNPVPEGYGNTGTTIYNMPWLSGEAPQYETSSAPEFMGGFTWG